MYKYIINIILNIRVWGWSWIKENFEITKFEKNGMLKII